MFAEAVHPESDELLLPVEPVYLELMQVLSSTWGGVKR